MDEDERKRRREEVAHAPLLALLPASLLGLLMGSFLGAGFYATVSLLRHGGELWGGQALLPGILGETILMILVNAVLLLPVLGALLTALLVGKRQSASATWSPGLCGSLGAVLAACTLVAVLALTNFPVDKFFEDPEIYAGLGGQMLVSGFVMGYSLIWLTRRGRRGKPMTLPDEDD